MTGFLRSGSNHCLLHTFFQGFHKRSNDTRGSSDPGYRLTRIPRQGIGLQKSISGLDGLYAGSLDFEAMHAPLLYTIDVSVL